jgi:hypothetical protein
MMTAAVLDPKLESVKRQIEDAFAGGPGPDGKDYAPAATAVRDASSMASAMLSAYHVAATVNPSKAFRAKGFTPRVQVGDPSELEQKAWWDSVLNIIQTVAPVVIDAVSKDYQPRAPQLSSIIAHLPAERQHDKAFADYATTLLLSLSQATIQAMSGQKDFTNPNTQFAIPQPPPGMPKGWFDDVCSFVSDAAPVALPIIMSLL